jgi:hypothetical protein
MSPTIPTGKLVFHIFGALTEFERNIHSRAHERLPRDHKIRGGWCCLNLARKIRGKPNSQFVAEGKGS